MDKKEIVKLVESIVTDVAANNNVNEGIARALVGALLTQSKQQIVNAVVVPRLNFGTPAATETPAS